MNKSLTNPPNPPKPDAQWFEDGACFASDNNLANFFSDDPQEVSNAFAVCAKCVVRGACLVDDFYGSSVYGLTYGVRAGYTASERTSIYTGWDENFSKRKRLPK